MPAPPVTADRAYTDCIGVGQRHVAGSGQLSKLLSAGSEVGLSDIGKHLLAGGHWPGVCYALDRTRLRAGRGYKDRNEMRMSRREFVAWDRKAITLMGMSGVGKTTLTNKLPKEKWFHFSGDYRIGTQYLGEPIMDNIKRQAMQVNFLRSMLRSDSIYIASNITIHNLTPISTFLGKLGAADKGGLPLEEFKRRQKLHHQAEIAAMRDVRVFLDKSRELYGYEDFVNDAGGSLCELDDPATIEQLAEDTVLFYIRASDEMEDLIIQRQLDYPKPLYYQDSFLDKNLEDYMQLNNHELVDDIEPDKFVRWVFPRLVAHRKPLYQSIADQYGYTVDARDVEQVHDENGFLDLIATSLQAAEAAA